jgi:SSS family solute:Na+ symporter/sodium/pantothenate symporter
MSTADSALLSLSSILAKDLVGKAFLPTATEATLTRLGKALSWAVMALLVGVALSPRITLWGLTEFKIEILAQVSPVFILGLGWRRLTAPAATAGMLVGAFLVVALIASGYGRIAGVHAGLIALAVNATLAVGLSKVAVRANARSQDGV